MDSENPNVISEAHTINGNKEINNDHEHNTEEIVNIETKEIEAKEGSKEQEAKSTETNKLHDNEIKYEETNNSSSKQEKLKKPRTEDEIIEESKNEETNLEESNREEGKELNDEAINDYKNEGTKDGAISYYKNEEVKDYKDEEAKCEEDKETKNEEVVSDKEIADEEDANIKEFENENMEDKEVDENNKELDRVIEDDRKDEEEINDERISSIEEKVNTESIEIRNEEQSNMKIKSEKVEPEERKNTTSHKLRDENIENEEECNIINNDTIKETVNINFNEKDMSDTNEENITNPHEENVVELRDSSKTCTEFNKDNEYEARPKKEKLLLLFLSYAEFVEELGISLLKLTSFVKLLTNANIINQQFNKTSAEILFKASKGRKQMDFNAFMIAVTKIGEQKYKRMNKEESGELIIAKLLTLYSTICADNIEDMDISPLGLVHKLSLDFCSKLILNSVIDVLLAIYKDYIGKCMIEAKTQEQALQIIIKDIFTFLKNFDLLRNSSVSKQSIVVMVTILVNSGVRDKALMNSKLNCGTVFTLEHFVMLLYWISILGFDMRNKDAIQYSPAEKVYYLLGKMEFSSAAIKKQISLMPPANIVQITIKNKPWKDNTTPQTKVPHRKNKEEQVEALERIFNLRSKFNRMSLPKYIALLKESKIIGNSKDIIKPESLFASAVKVSNKKSAPSNVPAFSPSKSKQKYLKDDKIDFKGFYWSLIQIAEKLYSSEKAHRQLEVLYEKHLSSLITGKEEDPRYILAKEEILQVLSLLKNSLELCVQKYKNADKRLNYSSFMRFCKDFGVFPDIVGMSFLRELFCSLVMAGKDEDLASIKEESIDETEVIQALGICALKSPSFVEDTNPVFKIIHLAEKMTRSVGVYNMKQIEGSRFDILKAIKRKYRNYFTLKTPEEEQEKLVCKLLN